MHAWTRLAIQWFVMTFTMTAVLRGQEAKVVIREMEGRAEILRTGSDPIVVAIGAVVGVGEILRTGASSRAVLQIGDRWLVRMDAETEVEIKPEVRAGSDKDALFIRRGQALIYSREPGGGLRLRTDAVTLAVNQSQLVVRVLPTGKTFIQVLQGEVELTNDFGRLRRKAGEAGEIDLGNAPNSTPVIETRNLLQWALYYPAVLHPDELGFTLGEERALALSLDAYRQGDLLAALNLHPKDYVSDSHATKLYRAAVVLATGQVDGALSLIRGVPPGNPGRRALERVLAAVLASVVPAAGDDGTAGEALAGSYLLQARQELDAALASARRATQIAPSSGFAWTRLAELEFSFGRTREAMAALRQGMALAPGNAQAHALRGYLFSAENQIAGARESFEEALRLDGGLGSAWLGLGLTKIRQGQRASGVSDLQTAATVEPTRSFFYSYHGKALGMAGNNTLARADLDRAKQLDPQDPTPWLYSAVQSQQENRYNPAIREMQESLRLNENRRVYRSRFLLDQDSAVRSSNLAKVYQNNGMSDFAVREATRAVESDYTNASAHLLLANSFEVLRDPNRTSLRYETAWFNEQLLAFLLAPVGGGPLSQFVSQHEYSKLLEADGLGGSSITEWREEGYLDHQTSLFSTTGRLSSGLDFAYHRNRGSRLNNATSRREFSGQFKYQASPQDILYTLGKWHEQEGGDLHQNYNNTPGNLGLRFEDRETPGLLLVGWNRRWAPGSHTLVLAGRLAGEQNVTAPGTSQVLLQRDPDSLQPGFVRPGPAGRLEYTAPELRNAPVPPLSTNPDGALNVTADFLRTITPFLGTGPIIATFGERFDFATQRNLEIYSAEVQQVWQTSRHTLLAGGRWQQGTFDTDVRLELLNRANLPYFTSPAALQRVSVDFARHSLYIYDFFKATRWLTVIGGFSWDRLERPENFRNPPVSARQVENEATNAKLGFTLAPSRSITIRGVYAEAIGGVTFDESVRLEPSQLAGFNQAFRTVISESIAGSVEAPTYKNAGLGIEGVLPTRTWWSASFNTLEERVTRTVGAFDVITASIFPGGVVILPSGRIETLAYREDVFSATLNQLLGDEFALGAGYRSTRAKLQQISPQIPIAVNAAANRQDDVTLQELTLTAHWNSPAGWLARAEASWLKQSLDTTVGGRPDSSPPGDRFWQVNAHAGYRFPGNRHEITGGVLNLTDRDYRLSPLTYTRELHRARTAFVRVRVSF